MTSRSLAAASLIIPALILTACGGEATPGQSAPATAGSSAAGGSAVATKDWAAHIQAIADASGEKAFSQVDVVGDMVTLTYMDGTTIMNGAGSKAGEFKYRTYDDFQDTRTFLPLEKLPVTSFAESLATQQKTCGDKLVTGRFTVTTTGAVVQRLGCESDSTRLALSATTVDGTPVTTLPGLDAASLDTVLSEAATLHGKQVAQIDIAPATAEEEATVVVTAVPRPGPAKGSTCAQLSIRHLKPGKATGTLLDYADCAMTPPATGHQLTLAGVKGETLVKGMEQAGKKLGVAPEAFTVMPASNPGQLTVKAVAGEKQASVTL